METAHAPKGTVRIVFCPICERDDRWAPLKARHFWHGSLCSGEIVEVVYRNPVVVERVTRV